MALYTPQNTTKVAEFLGNAQSMTNNYFGFYMLGLIFLIMLISFKKISSSSAFAAASFITVIFAAFFRLMGLTGDFEFYIALVILAISTTALYWEGR